MAITNIGDKNLVLPRPKALKNLESGILNWSFRDNVVAAGALSSVQLTAQFNTRVNGFRLLSVYASAYNFPIAGGFVFLDSKCIIDGFNSNYSLSQEPGIVAYASIPAGGPAVDTSFRPSFKSGQRDKAECNIFFPANIQMLFNVTAYGNIALGDDVTIEVFVEYQ